MALYSREYFREYLTEHGLAETHTKLMSEIDRLFGVTNKYTKSGKVSEEHARVDLRLLEDRTITPEVILQGLALLIEFKSPHRLIGETIKEIIELNVRLVKKAANLEQ